MEIFYFFFDIPLIWNSVVLAICFVFLVSDTDCGDFQV